MFSGDRATTAENTVEHNGLHDNERILCRCDVHVEVSVAEVAEQDGPSARGDRRDRVVDSLDQRFRPS